jgi:hypothetical protein
MDTYIVAFAYKGNHIIATRELCAVISKILCADVKIFRESRNHHRFLGRSIICHHDASLPEENGYSYKIIIFVIIILSILEVPP